ncbi:hypothetical protein ASG17_05810 [Brevundimonas sp. Leaf363]|uniref:hypothetical protein n=1 Tax=Brevundimonas sp. Leaf363 TaxID=1736353 RepID=UPI0006F670D7|nr:hypothetical protein [Brevundimonas sp. Leaf363]KQS55586.1 hypothetical protein ASG17_05810 [Brevundimonas sp. Leaf363]
MRRVAPLILAGLLAACASAPTADPAVVRVTDDFEAYAVGAQPTGPWSVATSNGEAVIDDTRAASGRRSLKIHLTERGGVLLTLRGGPLFPAGQDHLSGRMKVWLEAGPTDNVHWTLIEAGGRRRSDGRQAMVRFGGQHPIPGLGSRLMSNYDSPEYYATPPGPGSDCWAHAGDTDVMPEGRWVQVDWTIGQEGLRLSLDGRAIHGLDVRDRGQGCLWAPADYPWEIPVMERVSIGWESYQTDGPRTLWIDDVEVRN